MVPAAIRPGPARLVSLLPGATEILFALGLGDRIVAVSHECDFPPAAREKRRATRSLLDSALSSGRIDELVSERASLGQTLYELDRELLVSLQPDLIVTQAQCDVCAVRYEDVVSLVQEDATLAGAQILPLNPASLGDVLDDIVRIGEATGAEVEAARLYRRLRQRVSAIWTVAEDLPHADRPSVACIEWIEPLMTAGNWVPRLVELAGGRPVLAAEGRHSPYVSWESIRQADPDVLVVAPCGFDLARTLREAETLKELEGWGELAAVRNSRVWAVDGNAYFNRIGPRIVESLEILAHLLHPELFPQPALADAESPAFVRLD